jgi:hypothetical protein
MNSNERSVASLESEIMRLQEVLKEREHEISVLEATLQDKSPMPFLKVPESQPNAVETPHLSPNTLNRFEVIRNTMINGHDLPENGSDGRGVSEADESLDRLNELMLYVALADLSLFLTDDLYRSMAQKESHHREAVETLNDQLAQVRRQLDDLTTLSRDQVGFMNRPSLSGY